MSFFLDIAQGNTGGFCWYDVSADSLAELISPGLACGLTPGKRRAKYETASRDASPSPGASTKPPSPNQWFSDNGDVLNALEQYANPVLAML
jgi:hypothetical protein